jgi:hypothetical protein
MPPSHGLGKWHLLAVRKTDPAPALMRLRFKGRIKANEFYG